MNISNGIRRLAQLFVILFIALSGGLVYLQVVVAQPITANVHNERHCLPDTAPIRGRIFDRNGVLLAYSKVVTSSTSLACGYQRFYTDPSLAGLIGFYISPLFTKTGIESAYDDYLTGKRGLTELTNTVNQTLHRPPVGDDIYLTIDERIQKIVNSSFDIPATSVDHVETFPTNKGAVIVTDPHSGQILAMVSRPGFDPNRIAAGDLNYYNQLTQDPNNPLMERPIDACYVPGSTYKTMTLLAGLDSGKAQLSDPFYNDHQPDHKQAIGPITVGSGNNFATFGPNGNNIDMYTRSYPVTLDYGYAHSDNIIYAQVGIETGAATWQDYNNRFYVGRSIPFDLPVKVSTVTAQDGNHLCGYHPQNTDLPVNELAAGAFGQGRAFMTPMQMSLIDNIVANDGTLMKPMLVSKIVEPSHPLNLNDRSGTPIVQNDPQQLGTPVQQQTASQVRDAMLGVARCGSGRYPPNNQTTADPVIWTSPYSIIGKTGTGEVGGGRNAESWFITQAPYNNPKLTIVAVKENGGEGGPTDGPMLTHIYNQIFSSVKDWTIAPTQSTSQGVLISQYAQWCVQNKLLQQ